MGLAFFILFGDKTKESLERELAKVEDRIAELEAQKLALETEIKKLED